MNSTTSNILTNYLFHGTIGAVLFMLTYHFSINNYSTITALLPAVPLRTLWIIFNIQ